MEETLEVLRGAEANGAVAVAPDQKGGHIGEGRKHAPKPSHLRTPLTNDAKHVINSAWNGQAVDVPAQCVGGNACGISVHAAERGCLGPAWKRGDHAGKGTSYVMPVETDKLAAKIAEGIRRGEEDEPVDSMRVARRKRERNGPSMGMAGNIGLGKTECVHECDKVVGRRFQCWIEPRVAIGLTHIEQVDRIYRRGLCKRVDVEAPVAQRPHKPMNQKERRPTAGTQVVHPTSLNQDIGFADMCRHSLHTAPCETEAHIPDMQPCRSLQCYRAMNDVNNPIW